MVRSYRDCSWLQKFVIDIKDSSQVASLSPTADRPHPPQTDIIASLDISDTEAVFFESDDKLTPRSDILFPLLDTFFDYYSCHFPFHTRASFLESVRQKKVPALLLNSMCALAARFSDLPVFEGQLAYLRGESFANKAKLLLVPLMNLPSFEVVESILMIAWTELGTSHDVGLWMYIGMAVRMAEDLGMHKVLSKGARASIFRD